MALFVGLHKSYPRVRLSACADATRHVPREQMSFAAVFLSVLPAFGIVQHA